MKIQCECGKFQAELTQFPKNTPGRLMCYCDDCQTYMHYLGRKELLDPVGGTEIIPVYPSEFKILQGQEVLNCTRLSPKGLYRWSTSCCQTPIANTNPHFPWVGVQARPYNVKDSHFLEKTFGPIKSRIKGKFARGTPPQGTARDMTFKDAMVVTPFLLKGLLFGKKKPSPFFHQDGSPIAAPIVIPKEERISILKQLGFSNNE